jgi:hypothetical protein
MAFDHAENALSIAHSHPSGCEAAIDLLHLRRG